VTLNDLKKVLKAITQQRDGFKEVRSRKRHHTEEAARIAKKAKEELRPPIEKRKWTLMTLAQSPA
jgi:hypothetical protein